MLSTDAEWDVDNTVPVLVPGVSDRAIGSLPVF